MARQIAKVNRLKIDSMNKHELGEKIMKINPKSPEFQYAVKKFVNKRK
jgi:hypothetical protein